MDPMALRAGAALFDAGRYFEAHEVWEGPWLREPDPQVRRFLQALIQLAAGLHKLRSPAGGASAARLFARAMAKLADLPDELEGHDVAGLRRAAGGWGASIAASGRVGSPTLGAYLAGGLSPPP